jgi:hypothetical protein
MIPSTSIPHFSVRTKIQSEGHRCEYRIDTRNPDIISFFPFIFSNHISWSANISLLICFQVGNALLEFNTDFNSEGNYYWAHGLISDATYELINST